MRSKSKTQSKRATRAPLMMALEPRVMFDGAAAPTLHTIHPEHHATTPGMAAVHLTAEASRLNLAEHLTTEASHLNPAEQLAAEAPRLNPAGQPTLEATLNQRAGATTLAASRTAAFTPIVTAEARITDPLGRVPAPQIAGHLRAGTDLGTLVKAPQAQDAIHPATLGTTSVNSAAQLNAAIAADDLDLTGNDTINLTGNITYAAASDAAVITHPGTGTLTIDGNGFTINAAYLNRVLSVVSGTVVLENVTLEHGLLSGAGGALSLPGVSELGAGIYNAGSLTLDNVIVTGNVATGGGGGGAGTAGAGGGGGGGAGGIGGAAGGGIGATAGSGSTGGKGSGTGGGLGGGASGGGAGGTPTSGGSPGGSGATVTGNGLTSGGGGGGTGYVAGNGATGGSAAGGVYNAGTGKLFVLGSSAITNNLAAGGGGGGGIGLTFHGGTGGQGVGGIWNASTGQVYISASAYGAMTGNSGTSGTIGSATNGGSNSGVSTPTGDANLNTGSGTVTLSYVPPTVTSINRVGSSPNNAASDQFTVNFSEAVTGVNALDFSLVNTGTVAGVITSVTGSGSTYTVLVSPVTGDGTLGLAFNPVTPVVDASGGPAVSGYTSGQTYTIEHTPPVASITSSAANPNNAASDQFTVNFSENVGNVTAGDFTVLTTGTVAGSITAVTAVNPDANGRASAYTVTVGGVTGNGTLEVNLNATGTGITDAAGNAILGGAVGPVYGIEHTAPVVTSISTVGASPNNAGSDQYTVTFSENVTGVNALDFALANTGTAAGVITSVTGSGNTYTVLVNPVTGDGTMRLDFHPNTAVVDAAGNLVGSSYTSGQTYSIEHTPPVATSITTVGVSPNSATTEQFTVNFSENVTGVAVGDFSLLNTGTVTGTIASVSAVNGQSYTVTVTGVTGNGTMQLNLNASGTGIVDTAGNAIVGGSPLLDQGYTITHSLPVVTSIDTVGSSPNNAASDQFTVTFSENVTGVNVADFSLANTGTVAGVITSLTGSGNTYTVLVGPVTGDGTMALNFNPITPVADANGNLAAASFTSGQTYTIEHTPPVVTAITATSGDSGSGSSEQFTVNFSENVTGVTAADFSLVKTGTVTGAVTSVTGSGSTYTVTVGGVAGDGTLEVNLNAAGTAITDAAGNAILGGALGQVYVIEHTPPVATSITSTAANPNNAASDQFTVNFSENVGGVTAADFTLLKTGTVAASITAVTPVAPDASGRASAYTVTVGGVTGDGTLQLNLNTTGTGITDSSGNGLLGGAAGPVYGIEHTLPVVTAIDTVGASPNNAGSDQYTVTFSENVTGVNAADFSLTNTGTAGGVITSVTGSGNTYTVLVSPAIGDGTMRLDFHPVTAVSDAAGNLVGGSFTSGQVYTVEHTPPVATSIVAAAGDSSSGTSEQFTVNFSENVSGVTAGDFTLATAGTVGASLGSVTPVNPTNGAASAYTVTVTGVTGNGTLQLNLNATGTGITDAAGNTIVGGAVGPLFGVTHTLPTVSSIVLNDAATNNLSSEQFTVNFSENVTGVNAADFSLTNTGTAGGVITSLTGSGSTYVVLVSPAVGDGTMRLDLNAITTIVDATGNTTAGGYTAGPVYTLEHTPPVATSIVTANSNPNNASSEQYTVTFSENVTGVAAADFTLADTGTVNGTITSVTPVNPVNGSASTYTVGIGNVTGTGTMQLNLNASGTGITDAAGNAIVGGAVGEVYAIGHTLPVVTSIATVGANPNNASSDAYTVTFSENVTGVNVTDFSLAVTGTASGVITSVTGSGSTYTVLVDPVAGTGTLGLNFAPVTPVVDSYGNLVANSYTGATYTVDHTPPVATGITATTGDSSTATSDQFTVNFSENVTGVNTADFSLLTAGGATGTIASVTPVNPVNGGASSYTVLVEGVHGNGTLQLNLNAGTGITDAAGNVILGGALGPAYGVDVTAPSITSINLVNPSTNNLTTEQFTVNFSENVGGVNAADFVLTDSTGVGGSINSVAAVNPDGNGRASSYTVTVDNVTGNGTMRLDLAGSEMGITDASGNAASGGYTSGPSYTLQHTPPTVSSISLADAATNNRTSEQFTVNFSENVGGVNAGDFVLTDSTGVSGSISSVVAVNPDSNGRASSYTVTVNNVTGSGSMRLDLAGSESGITDTAGNPASGGYTAGPSYTINQTPPAVASIALVDAGTNNAGSEQFTVNFSENVGGVTAADFALATSGTVTGAVSSVTAVNPDANGRASQYLVTVGAVTGNGSMRLDLAATEAGITDAAGNAAIGGYTGGPSYTIEHSPPTVSSVTTVGVGPTNATSEVFTVAFSEGVTGVTASDFTAVTTGTVGSTSISVAPTAPNSNTYTVTVGGVTGNGTLGLNVNASGTGITDAAGNALLGGFSTGATITIDNTPPTVSSIALVNAPTNNLASDQFTVTFSQSVSGVTAADFALNTTGSVSGSIASVVAVNPDILGHATTYTVTVNNVGGDGTMRLDLAASETGITDYAGNSASGGYTSGPSYTLQHTPPAVSSIALVDAATNNAATEQFTVNFTQAVGGVTAGDFGLTDGGTVSGTVTSVTAVNPDANGRASSYTVTVNPVSGDGTMRLDLNSTQSGITDTAGNAATGGYTAGPSYTIEHTPPAVTSIALVDAATNNAATEQFTVNFSEAVSGVTAGDFVLSNGGTVSGTITSVTAVNPDANGRASSYTVMVNPVTGDGTMRLDLNSTQSGITDTAGNAATGGYTAGPSYTIEHTPPAVTSIALVDAATNNAATEQFTVNFSEAVSGVTAGDFVLSNGGTVSGTITSVTAVNPDANGRASSYTVMVNPVTGDGTMRLDLNSTQSGITDTAGNAATGGYTAGPSYTIEHTPPAVTSIALVDAATNNAATEQFTVNFSEAVGGVSAGDFVLSNGGTVAGSIASVTAVNPDANGRASSYTVTVNPVTGDGTMRLDLNSTQSGITDTAGNAAAGGYTAGPSYTLEHTPPVVASIDTVGSASNDAGSEQFTVNFSEAVSGVTAGDFVLSNGGTVVGSIASVTAVNPDANGRASSYTVTVGGVSGSGTMRLDLAGTQSGISDAAGNAVTGGYTAGEVYQLGAVSPAVQSITTTGAATNNATSETFVVNFNENVTGVAVGDFALTTTGTAAGTVAAVSGSGSLYTVTVSGVSGDGTLRLDLNAGTGILDSAGNPVSAAFTTGQVYTLEHTPPVVASIDTVGSASNDAGSEQFTVNFSEAVSGVTAGDFVLSNGGTVVGSIASVTAVNPDANGRASSYTVTVGGVSGSGTMRLDLAGTQSGISDAAGNAVTGGYTAGEVYQLGAVSPAVQSITTTGAATNNATSETFVVNFNENVTGVAVGDFALTTTGTAAGTVAAVSGSGSLYTVTVSGVSGDGTLRLDLNAGTGILDSAGNPVSAAFTTGQVYTLEHTPPVITSIVAPDTGPTNATSEQFTVTFSENVTGVDAADFTVLGTGTAGGTISSVTGSGKVYTVTVGNLTGDGTVQLGLSASGGSISDASGNPVDSADPGTGVTGGAVVPVQHTPPSVSSIDTQGANPNNATTETFTVTFSEDVSGVSAGDFSLVNTGTAGGEITSVTGSGKTYVVTVSGATGDGTMRLDLNPSGTGITDAAGNAVTGGFTAGQTYTLAHSSPAVESVSAPPNGTYTAGQTLQFTVTFSEPVTVNTSGGDPRLLVNLGSGGTHYATYVSGSGTDMLVFQYTVGATDQSPSGLTLGKAIDLNGATLADAVGNPGQLTLASVASDSGVIIGDVPPQLPVTQTAPAAPSSAGGSGAAPAATSAGYVANAVEADHGLATASILPTGDVVDPLAGSAEPLMTNVGAISLDQSIQPPLAVATVVEPLNSSFAFSIPVGSFQFDPGSTIGVSAAMANGNPLPSWLSFDPSTGKFQGVAPAGWSQHLHIIVDARDQNGRDVMLPVEVEFGGARDNSSPTTWLAPRPHRNLVPHPGKESLTHQFARHGRRAREREFAALVNAN
jgi:hypothetical protein